MVLLLLLLLYCHWQEADPRGCCNPIVGHHHRNLSISVSHPGYIMNWWVGVQFVCTDTTALHQSKI